MYAVTQTEQTHISISSFREPFNLNCRYCYCAAQVHPTEKYYPLRPEFVESAYYLYQATKNPHYLLVGHACIRVLAVSVCVQVCVCVCLYVCVSLCVCVCCVCLSVCVRVCRCVYVCVLL